MNVKVTRKMDDDEGWHPYDRFEGFTKLDEIEWDNESYAFDITGLWVRDSDKTVWFADDSGCSCPTPWENTDTLERLFNMEPLIEKHKAANGVIQAEWESFKAKAEAALAALAT